MRERPRRRGFRERRAPRGGWPGCRRRSSRGRGSPSVAALLPDLHRDLLDRERDRRLRLRGADRYLLRVVALEHAVRYRRAQALEGLVRTLLCGERDLLADVRVVDRVLHAVGHRRVGVSHLEGEVEHEALAHVALGLLDAVVGVQRQARDLDRDRRLGSLAVLVVWVYAIRVVFQFPSWVGTVAAATFSASATGATSCTRKIDAPRSYASTFVAIVPGTRSRGSRPVIFPRKLLRDVPTTTGRPIATISSSRRSSSRLCSTVLPNPMPGSSQTRSSGTPSPTAKARRSSRNALTSETTSS